MAREIHLELLLGAKVCDMKGKHVGRIEEVVAEQQGGECIVREYLLGRAAFFNRLSVNVKRVTNLNLFGKSSHQGYRVPWNKLDLSDPQRPRLKCAKEDLKRLE